MANGCMIYIACECILILVYRHIECMLNVYISCFLNISPRLFSLLDLGSLMGENSFHFFLFFIKSNEEGINVSTQYNGRGSKK